MHSMNIEAAGIIGRNPTRPARPAVLPVPNDVRHCPRLTAAVRSLKRDDGHRPHRPPAHAVALIRREPDQSIARLVHVKREPAGQGT